MQNKGLQGISKKLASALQAEGPWFESMCLHTNKTRQSHDWRVFVVNDGFCIKCYKMLIKYLNVLPMYYLLIYFYES